MQKLKLILIFFFLPLKALADTGVLSKGLGIFEYAWHHQIFVMDNQPVTVANIIIGIVSLIIGLKIAKYLSTSLKKKLFTIIKLDKNSTNLISRVIDYIFIIIVILIVLDIAGVPLTIFTFIGGAFVISIGLSAQHLINNFISGVVLIVEGKILVGDLIEFGEIMGRVESIEARAIQIRTQDNIDIFIPNSKLMQESFINWTHNDSRVRISTTFKIDQKDNINHNFTEIVCNAVLQNRYVLVTPKPQVLLTGFEENILCYEVNFWINLVNADRRLIISDVNNQILSALSVHRIPLAIRSRKHIV